MTRGSVAKWIVGVIATVTLLFSAYLLIVGVDVSVSTGGPVFRDRETMWSAIIPLAGSLAALLGVIRSHRTFVTGGALTVLVFGVLFVFSAGLYFAFLGIAMVLAAVAASRALPPKAEGGGTQDNPLPGGSVS